MVIATQTTNTDTPPGDKATDVMAQRKRHAAIEKEYSALVEATASMQTAVQRLRAEHAAADAAAQTAQRDYAAALAHHAVSKAPTGAPPAPGQALAHAQGLAAAIEIAESMVRDAQDAEAPVRARLADARDALEYAEWQAALSDMDAGIKALMPTLAHLRSTTQRRQAPWYMPDLHEYLRAWEHAQGIAEPLNERRG